MAIQLQNTNAYESTGINAIIYGRAKTEKTRLARTLPNCIIMNVEKGLLSLKGEDIAYADVNTFVEANEFLNAFFASEFENLFVDSISELAEIELTRIKKGKPDARQAYGEVQDSVYEFLRKARERPNGIKKNVFVIAKQNKIQDDMGQITYYPDLPGKSANKNLPYIYDGIYCTQTFKDESGVESIWLQTKVSALYQAGDRSGKLEPFEPMDLGAMIKKIGG